MRALPTLLRGFGQAAAKEYLGVFSQGARHPARGRGGPGWGRQRVCMGWGALV